MKNYRSDLKLWSGAVLLLVCGYSAAFQSVPRWAPTESWFTEPRIYERPKAGYVPSRESAVAIGRAIFRAAYGKVFTKGLEPLDANLFGDVWIVYSYFPEDPKSPALGGVTTVEISKTSGSVLSLRSER